MTSLHLSYRGFRTPSVSCLSIRIDCKGRGVIGDVQQKIIRSSRNWNQFSKIFLFFWKCNCLPWARLHLFFAVWANDLCMFFGCLLLQLKTHSLTPYFQGNQDTIHSWNVSSIWKTHTHEHRLFVCLYKKIWLPWFTCRIFDLNAILKMAKELFVCGFNFWRSTCSSLAITI